MKTFKDRLKYAREQRGSQKAIARKMGELQQTISNWERGEGEPSIEKLAKLIEIIKVDANWLITGKGSILDKDEAEGLELIRRLKETGAWGKGKSYLEFLASEQEREILQRGLTHERKIKDRSIPEEESAKKTGS